MACFTWEYETASAAAQADAIRMLTALQILPGGFGGPRIDDENTQHQRCLDVYLVALGWEEENLRSRVGDQPDPWVALANLHGACDMASGWLARIIKQTGGVPHDNV